MTSKLEINVRGLIAQCEEFASVNNQDWRLKKYIKSLDTMISELEEQFDKPEEKLITEYRNRCGELKKLANYVEPSPNLEQKRLKSKLKASGDSGEDVMREIRQIHDQKFQKELRSELFNGNFNSTIRRRAGQKVAENLEQTVKQYSDVQEKIAEDMLLLTRNLKEQTETANKIIKKDTEIVSKSAKLTDQNMSSLSTESTKLQESSKKAWKCWMWMMIGLVMMIFISKQAEFYKITRVSLSQGEVLFVANFLENYSFVFQDSVQDVYYNKLQATVHPFNAYFLDYGVIYEDHEEENILDTNQLAYLDVHGRIPVSM